MYSENLKKVLNNIRATQGKEVIVDLVNASGDFPLLCSSESLGLDEALGGGWAKGRVIEVSGPESSGKTTLALHAIINIQKQGRIAAFVDYEQAFDKNYFVDLGGNVEDLIFIQPDSAEQGMNVIEMLAESREVALIVIDSTNAATPKAELEGEAGDLKVGLAARLWGQHLRKVNISVKNGITLFYISQMREKIGIMFGDPRVIGVGNAMKFYASQRVMFSKMSTIKIGEESVANQTKAKVIKNKVAPPFKEAIFSIVFGKGVSQESEIISACLTRGILIKDGQGVKVTFDTPLWSKESAIESTEAKTEAILQTEDFTHLFKEIKLRLNLFLNKITLEKLTEEMQPIWDTFKVSNEQFEKLVAKANEASGKSQHVPCLFYCMEALKLRPLDKKMLSKLKQMEVAIDKRITSNQLVEWDIQVDDTLVGYSDANVKLYYEEFSRK